MRGHWNFSLSFHRDAIPNDNLEAHWNPAACTSVRWEYCEAAIEFDCTKFFGFDDEEAEKIVIHELCHVIVNELRNVPDDWLKHEEHVVSTLANIFRWFPLAETLATGAAELGASANWEAPAAWEMG